MLKENLDLRKKDFSQIGDERFFENDEIFKEENNKVVVSGTFLEDLEYSHYAYEENFYKTKLVSTRASGVKDYIPIVISEKLLKRIKTELKKGTYVEVYGNYHSFTITDDEGVTHLGLNILARYIKTYDILETKPEEVNYIYLQGYICKKPVYRETPLGKNIADLLIAVNRNYNKTDYIPCIAWSRTALYVSKLNVGNKIELYGRMQSREFDKKISDITNETVRKEVYEISISRLAKVDQ